MKIRTKVRALDVASAVIPATDFVRFGSATPLGLTDDRSILSEKSMVPSQPTLGLGLEPSADDFLRIATRLRSLLPHQDLLATEGATKKLMSAVLDHGDHQSRVEAVKEILLPLSRKERELVLHEFELMLQIADLRERMTGADRDAVQARAHFDAILPEFQEKWHEVVRRSKVVPLPPTVNTAGNLEALIMANIYTIEPVTYFSKVPGDHQDSARAAALTMVEHLATKNPPLQRIVTKLNQALGGLSDEDIAALHTFGVSWMRSGFAKLEIGHKLAASLALTDVPDDIEVQAPWAAWSLVVPPDLFGGEGVARVWCEGDPGAVRGGAWRDSHRRHHPGNAGRRDRLQGGPRHRACARFTRAWLLLGSVQPRRLQEAEGWLKLRQA